MKQIVLTSTLALSVLAGACHAPALLEEDDTLAEAEVTEASDLYLDTLVASTELALTPQSVVAGQTVTATVTFTNTGATARVLQRIVIAGRPPGGTHAGGPFLDFGPALGRTTVRAGASLTVTQTRTFASSDPTGTWEAYPAVRGNDGVWRDYPGTTFAVGEPRLEHGPLTLSATTVGDGQVLTGSVTYTNTGAVPGTIQQLVITARRPGADNVNGPFDDFSPRNGSTVVQPGATLTLQASRTFTAADPGGTWTAFATYQNAAGWHDGTPVTFAKVTTPIPTPTPPAPPMPAPTSEWLATNGNKIVRADGTVWAGRGVNMMDTRGCGACVGSTPNANEVIRRIDEAVDNWHVDFIRLALESYTGIGANRQPLTADPAYLADIVKIVRHIQSKPGVYVLLSLWVDPTFSAAGWPTTQTLATWRTLAATFKNDARVLFGLVNEPQQNYDGAQDAAVWTAMNATVAAIREVEAQSGTPAHVISVQGTGGWARRLGYYVTHPIAANGGANVAYETHVYDPTANFKSLFIDPAKTLPVIIGEFGPLNMTMTDTANLMVEAEKVQVPYLAWTFHMRCPPNLLVDNSGQSCGVNMNLQPTAWGQQLKTRLASPPQPSL